MTGLDFFAKAQVVEKRNNISEMSFETNAQPSEIISTHYVSYTTKWGITNHDFYSQLLAQWWTDDDSVCIF